MGKSNNKKEEKKICVNKISFPKLQIPFFLELSLRKHAKLVKRNLFTHYSICKALGRTQSFVAENSAQLTSRLISSG